MIFESERQDARVIFVTNRETGEKINLYGWVHEDKEAPSFVIYDATTHEMYAHEYDLETYEWKYAKKKFFHFLLIMPHELSDEMSYKENET